MLRVIVHMDGALLVRVKFLFVLVRCIPVYFHVQGVKLQLSHCTVDIGSVVVYCCRATKFYPTLLTQVALPPPSQVENQTIGERASLGLSEPTSVNSNLSFTSTCQEWVLVSLTCLVFIARLFSWWNHANRGQWYRNWMTTDHCGSDTQLILL